jgi:hypothetical protein
MTEYDTTTEEIKDRLLTNYDTAEVLVFDDGQSGSERAAHIGYYANSSNGVWPMVLRYLQSEGFVIMESSMRYLEESEACSFPERAGRELCYVEAKREREPAPEVYH